MRDLDFDVQVIWSGTGRGGAGLISMDGPAQELSTPASMGGRGAGTNPEELLVAAVSSCYSATLFGVLTRAGLPVSSLTVSARGTVTGFPGRARFEQIIVSPTILEGDVSRRGEYEQAAQTAHERCFIGGTLASDVAYEVGAVEIVGFGDAREPSSLELAPLASANVGVDARAGRAA